MYYDSLLESCRTVGSIIYNNVECQSFTRNRVDLEKHESQSSVDSPEEETIHHAASVPPPIPPLPKKKVVPPPIPVL